MVSRTGEARPKVRKLFRRTTAQDCLQPIGFGLRMSVIAETSRSGVDQAAGRSTLKLDVQDSLTLSRLKLPSFDLRPAAFNSGELALPTQSGH